MKTRLPRWLITFCVLAVAQSAAASIVPPSQQAAAITALGSGDGIPEQQRRVGASMAELPVCFEQNVGQTDSRVSFLARASGVGVFLTPDACRLLRRGQARLDPARADNQAPTCRLGRSSNATS